MIASLVVVIMVAFIILTVVSFAKKKKDLLEEKAMLKARFEQTLLQTQLEIQEQTLRTISQEIHDNIGQVLSLAKLNLAAIGAANTSEQIIATKDLVSKAIADLRDLSKSLNADRIKDIGLATAIQHELQQLEKTKQFTTSFDVQGNITALAAGTTVILFRMIQETLNNIMKHAQATHVAVSIVAKDDVWQIAITDNGIGFNSEAQSTGLGLKNIIQRAALIGAVAEVNSTPGIGTSVLITIKP